MPKSAPLADPQGDPRNSLHWQTPLADPPGRPPVQGGRAVGWGEAPQYPKCRRPGGLRGTESPVQEARGLTGDGVPCAGGQGAYGGRSPLCRRLGRSPQYPKVPIGQGPRGRSPP